MAQAPLVFSGFPVGYCYPSSPTQLFTDAFSLTYANVPTNVQGVVWGPTEPNNPSTNRLWYNSNVNRLYSWDENKGRWIALYPVAGDPKIKMITEMTELEIQHWDDPAAAADAVLGAEQWTGPFWKIDHEYDGRFVVGPGALPSTAVIALLQEGGSDKMPLTAANLPKHRHEINVGPESGDSSYLPDATLSENGTFKVNGSEQIRFYDLPSTEIGRTRENVNGSTDTSGVDPVSILPPYRAAWIVKRTARIYYTL